MVWIPVVLFLFSPLVDELNSLFFFFGPLKFKQKTRKSHHHALQQPLTQTDRHQHCTCQSMPLHHMKGMNDIPIATCAEIQKSSTSRPQHMHATTPTVEFFPLPPPTAPHPPNQRAHHCMTPAHRQRHPQPSRSSRRANNGWHPHRDNAPFRLLFRVGVTCQIVPLKTEPEQIKTACCGSAERVRCNPPTPLNSLR